jgi:hypothetical protein
MLVGKNCREVMDYYSDYIKKQWDFEKIFIERKTLFIAISTN